MNNPAEESKSWCVSLDPLKKLTFDHSDPLEYHLRKWALENGFELIKNTSVKSYALYMDCSRGGKPRKFAGAVGKRSKPSKKIGKNTHLCSI